MSAFIQAPPIAVPAVTQHDPLDYLTRSTVTAYPKGGIIYTQDQPATNIYLLVQGKVTVSRLDGHGKSVLLHICLPEEFFGEASLSCAVFPEAATAIEKCLVMTWRAEQIEEIATARPNLALALLQMTSRRSVELIDRIEGFAHCSIEDRLAKALLGFAERFGSPAEGGCVEISPFTHESLAKYVGTSREVVTGAMGRFRAKGWLRYSRHSISINVRSLAAQISQPAAFKSANPGVEFGNAVGSSGTGAKVRQMSA